MCRLGSFQVVDGLSAEKEAITLLWHFSQAVEAGCPVLGGGGVAWQAVPQAFQVSSTWFHTGVVLTELAPASAVPWQ
jgi:hypothetical protein